MNKDLKDFLRRLNVKHFCYGPTMIEKSLKDVLHYNKVLEADAYFYVNQKFSLNVKEVRCCFVDLDVGRDSRKKYFSIKQVAKLKLKLMEQINNCPVDPHYIVETRNGYQLYWIINPLNINRSTFAYWNGIQYKIKKYFGKYADQRVGKINQIMRLPTTWWYKKAERKPKFFVCFVKTPRKFRTYDIKYINSKFFNTSQKGVATDTQEFDNAPVYSHKTLGYTVSKTPEYPIPPKKYTLKTNNAYSSYTATQDYGINKDIKLALKKILQKMLQTL